MNFKRVPAIDKCFAVLGLMAESKRAFGFNEIVKALDLNKSTVFNILHTLNDLGVLDKGEDGMFKLGPRLFVLGNAAAGGAELIKTVHPYLENINKTFKFSTFLGILSNEEVIIIDKADQAHLIKISAEIGMRRPFNAGVSGKALLAQLSEERIDEILSKTAPVRYTPKTITDKNKYKAEILKVKSDGIAYDWEEYIEGMVGVAVPLRSYRQNLHATIWTVGLRHDFTDETLLKVTTTLNKTADEINSRFSLIAGNFNSFE